MTITFEDLSTLGGTLLSGIAVDPGGDIFFASDIGDLNASGATGITFINVRCPENASDELGTVLQDTIAAIGINADGIMDNPDDLLVLPCPPHCGDGKGGGSVSRSGDTTLDEAVGMF